MNSVLKVENLSKAYPLPDGTLRVFEGLDLEIRKGELIAVMGVSGVGKTTLLNLIGGLDRPSGGRVLLEGEDVFANDERSKARMRNEKIGMIFQFYHLLPEFTALENVCFPLLIKGMKISDAAPKAMELLREVSLAGRANQRPSLLSGGEQQRIAIARALVNEPRLLLADEPTGNLDWKSGQTILELIQELHLKKNLSSIIVTHNEKVANFCQKAYLMEGGRLKLLSRL